MSSSLEIDFLSPLAGFFQFGLKWAGRSLAAELTSLGFQWIGIQRETTSEGRRTHALAFSGEQHRTWASVFLARGEPCLYLYTAFEGGQVVLTGRYGRPDHESERAILTGLPDVAVAELLATHHRCVARMEAHGRALPTPPTVAARLDAAHRYYENPDCNRSGTQVRRAA